MHILFVSSEVTPFAKTGGLADVFTEDQGRRKREALESEDRTRRRGFEDQRAGIERASALRNIFGVEEVGGGLNAEGRERFAASDKVLEESRAPLQDLSPTPGSGVGVRGQLQPRPQPQRRPSAPLNRGPEINTAPPPTGRLFDQPNLRKLEPSRDPTIVNPELRESAGPPQFDFSNFEDQLELPAGSLQAGFDRNPVGALNLIIDKASKTGGVPTSELNAIRSVVQTRINAVSAQLENDILSKGEEQSLRDEIDELTIGLVDAATGGNQEFNLDSVLDELERLFPDVDDDELAQKALRIQRVRRGAGEFTGRVRGQLEPAGR